MGMYLLQLLYCSGPKAWIWLLMYILFYTVEKELLKQLLLKQKGRWALFNAMGCPVYPACSMIWGSSVVVSYRRRSSPFTTAVKCLACLRNERPWRAEGPKQMSSHKIPLLMQGGGTMQTSSLPKQPSWWSHSSIYSGHPWVLLLRSWTSHLHKKRDCIHLISVLYFLTSGNLQSSYTQTLAKWLKCYWSCVLLLAWSPCMSMWKSLLVLSWK